MIDDDTKLTRHTLGMPAVDANKEPCVACPWRTENHGKRHPDGWYTEGNRRRLWVGLRRGKDMSCHPTDANNPVSDKAQHKGVKVAPEHAEIRLCAGALILQQREFTIAQAEHASDVKTYRRARPFGLTMVGLSNVMMSAAFGGPRPNLNAPVSHKPLGAWTSPKEK